MLIGLLSALVATVLNTVAGLLQADATTHILRRRPLAVQPRNLVGLVVDGLGWVATVVVALRHLPVFAVQAILGGAIALTALATRWRFRNRDAPPGPGRRRGVRARAAAGGRKCGGDAPESVGAVADLMLGGAMVVLAGVLVACATAVPRGHLRWSPGSASGGTALAVRAVHVRQGPHSTRPS
jgi:hypothetical protein